MSNAFFSLEVRSGKTVAYIAYILLSDFCDTDCVALAPRQSHIRSGDGHCEVIQCVASSRADATWCIIPQKPKEFSILSNILLSVFLGFPQFIVYFYSTQIWSSENFSWVHSFMLFNCFPSQPVDTGWECGRRVEEWTITRSIQMILKFSTNQGVEFMVVLHKYLKHLEQRVSD